MKCNVCGNVVAEGAKECAVCGSKLADQVVQEKVTKEHFLESKTQYLLIGLVPLFLLFYWALLNLINYINMARFNGADKVLGIFGSILTLVSIIGLLCLTVIQILYAFRKNIQSFDKMSVNFPFIGLIIHGVIIFFTFTLSIWRVALNFGARDFFTQQIIIYGLQAIHILLFAITEKPKNIFPGQAAKPSQVKEQVKEGE